MKICTAQKQVQAWNRKAVCSPDGAASLLIASKWGKLRNLFPERCPVRVSGTSRHGPVTTSGVWWTNHSYSGLYPKKYLKKKITSKYTQKSQKKDLAGHICVLRKWPQKPAAQNHLLTGAPQTLHCPLSAHGHTQGIFQTDQLDIYFSCDSEFWCLCAWGPEKIASKSQVHWILQTIQQLWLFHLK